MDEAYQKALTYINTRGRGEHPAGLDTMRELCRRLGDPQRGCSFIHVAGTNGKGSITAMLAQVFSAAGYKTGRYISPYVTQFQERISVDGVQVSKQQVVRLADAVREVAGGLNPSFFEVLTAMAFLHFQQQGCDIVCLETGLGGRLDATNVIDCPVCSVLTLIGMDHEDLLGHSIEKIAAEKCGIFKPDGTVVCYPLQREEALGVIFEKAAQMNASVVLPAAGAANVLESTLTGNTVELDGVPYTVPLGGRHQAYNLLTALSVLDVAARAGFPTSRRDRQQGLAAVRFPARLEVLKRHPLVLLDGAHNEDGATSLREALALLPAGTRLVGVAGMLRDKEYSRCMALLAPLFSRLFLTAPDNPRALPAQELCAAAAPYCPGCEAVPGPARLAVERALAETGSDDVLVLFGSLYLAGEVRPLFLK